MIYILRLENNKYYIGKTNNLEERLKAHDQRTGCAWTSKYKFVELIETIDTDNIFEEDKCTKEYMNKYGIDNVRGGSYCQISLSPSDKKCLERELFHAKGLCLQCGNSGHFVTDCKNNKVNLKKDQSCSRCGRNNHSSDNCYAKKYLDGSEIKEKEDELMNVAKYVFKSIKNWFK